MPRNDEDSLVITKTKKQVQTRTPRMFRVLLHNDNFTTRDFVVWILESVFQKSEDEATQIMLHVHKQGVGVAGIYSREIAESKAAKVIRLATAHEFPLRASSEPDES